MSDFEKFKLREKTIFGTTVLSANTDITLIELSFFGKAQIIGGSIIMTNDKESLSNLKLSLNIDNEYIYRNTLGFLNEFKLFRPETSPLYLIKYYEDATKFGSWLTSSKANNEYNIGISNCQATSNFFLNIVNDLDVDIPISYFMRFYVPEVIQY